MAKLSEAQKRILTFLQSQPAGGCRVNWLPDDISPWAYRLCRNNKLLRETKGRSGFKIALLTPAGRAALGDTHEAG